MRRLTLCLRSSSGRCVRRMLVMFCIFLMSTLSMEVIDQFWHGRHLSRSCMSPRGGLDMTVKKKISFWEATLKFSTFSALFTDFTLYVITVIVTVIWLSSFMDISAFVNSLFWKIYVLHLLHLGFFFSVPVLTFLSPALLMTVCHFPFTVYPWYNVSVRGQLQYLHCKWN
jgi:hypothetical protein